MEYTKYGLSMFYQHKCHAQDGCLGGDLSVIGTGHFL